MYETVSERGNCRETEVSFMEKVGFFSGMSSSCNIEVEPRRSLICATVEHEDPRVDLHIFVVRETLSFL